MKKILALTTALLIAAPVLAETPNRTTMSFEEYVTASGCTIVDKGGYTNVIGPDGGGCLAIVKFTGVGTRVEPGDDGILGTADDRTVSDN